MSKSYGVTVSTEDFKSFSQGSIPCGTNLFSSRASTSMDAFNENQLSLLHGVLGFWGFGVLGV